ncbi:MAG TPA: hypothetical protein DEP84_37095 [Chloroflexi bacterium]|nr:hypothetical protein [Chloroflexota bacterium]
MTRSDKFFAVLGRMFLGWILAVGAYWLASDMGKIYSARLETAMALNQPAQVGLERAVAVLRTASRFSALLPIPAMAFGAYLGIRRIRRERAASDGSA